MLHMKKSPEKHPAGSGPYAKGGGIYSLRLPPVKSQQFDKTLGKIRINTKNKITNRILSFFFFFSKSYLLALGAPLHPLEFPDPIP